MKTIVILSSEPWGKMMLSKMHFARELSEMGHWVFFVDPPRKSIHGKPVEKPESEKNLVVIRLREHPLRVFAREKCYPLFRLIERRYVNRIKKITGRIDELWCFNPHFISDIDLFSAGKTLLLVYDRYRGKNLKVAASKADAIISIAQNILDTFHGVEKPALLVHHGLAPAFEKYANVKGHDDWDRQSSEKIRIGYVGNLLRGAIDANDFKKIIAAFPQIDFHFWGPSGLEENNVSGNDFPSEAVSFINFLNGASNVTLHGVKIPEDLASDIQEMDAFVFLYSGSLDINNASNSHKIMEYLSTGKVIIATHVSSYEGIGLFPMQGAGEDFAEFFGEVVRDLKTWNSSEQQEQRIGYALDNTYRKQIERISSFVGTGK